MDNKEVIEQIAQKICKIGTGCSLDCVLIPEYREQFRQCATEIYQLCEAEFLKKSEGELPENPYKSWGCSALSEVVGENTNCYCYAPEQAFDEGVKAAHIQHTAVVAKKNKEIERLKGMLPPTGYHDVDKFYIDDTQQSKEARK